MLWSLFAGQNVLFTIFSCFLHQNGEKNGHSTCITWGWCDRQYSKLVLLLSNFQGFILALKGVWVGWDDWVWLVVGWVVE